MWTKIFLILFEVGFAFKFQLFGQISISEIVLLLISPILIQECKGLKEKEITPVLLLYIGFIAIQLITEQFTGNTTRNILRGIAVNVVSILHILLIYKYAKKSPRLIAYIFLGIAIKFLIGYNEEIADGIKQGEHFFVQYLKFYLAPALTCCLYFYTLTSKEINPNKIRLIFFLTGISLVILGTRSSGGALIAAAMLDFLFRKQRQHVLMTLLIGVSIGYGAYCYYVSRVLAGEITLGNSAQLQSISDPYNPISLLLAGRTEVFVGYLAFLDKPLTGWGAWAEDPHNFYNHLLLQLKDDTNDYILYETIPSHSVIMGSAMMHGILGLIIILSIFISIVTKAIRVLNSGQTRTLPSIILCSMLISFIWNMLFSPQSTLRESLAVNMAIILIYHRLHLQKTLLK